MKKVLGLLVLGLLIAGAAQAGSLSLGVKYLGIWTHVDSGSGTAGSNSTTLNMGAVVADVGYKIIPNLLIEGEFGLLNSSNDFLACFLPAPCENTATSIVPIIGVDVSYEFPAMLDGKLIISAGGGYKYIDFHSTGNLLNGAGIMDEVLQIWSGKGGVEYKLSDVVSLFGAVEVGESFLSMNMATAAGTAIIAPMDLGSGLAITYQAGVKTYLF